MRGRRVATGLSSAFSLLGSILAARRGVGVGVRWGVDSWAGNVADWGRLAARPLPAGRGGHGGRRARRRRRRLSEVRQVVLGRV